jgi:hypothetical protein
MQASTIHDQASPDEVQAAEHGVLDPSLPPVRTHRDAHLQPGAPGRPRLVSHRPRWRGRGRLRGTLRSGDGVAVERSRAVASQSLPSTTAPVVAVIVVKARIDPLKVEFVPSVAELPTCQKTLQAWAPLIRFTLLPDAVISVEPAWK